MKKTAILCLSALLLTAPLAACGSKEEILAADVPAAEVQQEETIAPEIPEIPEIPEEEAVPAFPGRVEYILVQTNGLNVRSGAGTSYTSLGTAEKGILLKYDGVEGDWYKTVYRGRTAYVSAKPAYTAISRLNSADDKIENVIDVGLKYLGVPYVYGATRLHDGKGNLLKGFTTEKFDCSSLMQYIFYEGAGVLLDVNTRTQIKQGTKVASGDLKRGDLMFFTNASRYNNTGIERVGHVALYLGDNYILHTASDYAKVEQISATRWSYFLEARRVF